MKSAILKTFLALIVGLTISPAVEAHTNPDSPGMSISLSGGLSPERNATGHDIGFILSPSIGYRINSKWFAGVSVSYEKLPSSVEYLGIGASGRFVAATAIDGHLKLNIIANARYIFDLGKYYGGSSHDFVEAGFTPGVSYLIPDSQVEIMLNYLFIGFNNNRRRYKEEGGCLGRSNWIADAGLRRLQLGVAIHF